MNPYESPVDYEEPPSSSASPADSGTKYRLVGRSLFLAFFCEVLPLEADCVYVFLRSKDIPSFLLVRGLFLVIVLGPLVRYLQLNGKAGLKEAWGKIATVVFIVGVKLTFEIYALMFQPVR